MQALQRDGLIMTMKESQYDRVLDTDLKGAFNMIRHGAPIMLRQRSGKIINISSVVGLTGNAGQANYAAAKAGLIGLTKSIAKELAPRGICCNAVAPGFIQTDMTSGLGDQAQKLLDAIPLGRTGLPEEVAGLVAFPRRTGQRLCDRTGHRHRRRPVDVTCRDILLFPGGTK